MAGYVSPYKIDIDEAVVKQAASNFTAAQLQYLTYLRDATFVERASIPFAPENAERAAILSGQYQAYQHLIDLASNPEVLLPFEE